MRSLVLAMTITLAWGCGESTTGPSTGSEIGSYALVSLNGRALPTSISEGSGQIEVVAGTLTLGTGASVRTSTSFRPSPGAAPMTNEVSGTYTIQGSTLTFSYTNGGRSTATLSGDTLQVPNEGVAWLYQRR